MNKSIKFFIILILPLIAVSLLVSIVKTPVIFAAKNITACQNNITVINNNSNGEGSLRQAIVDVCDEGLITFNDALNNSIIDVSPDGELVITHSLSISSSIPITISGNNTTRVFNIQAGNVAINHLTIANGNVQTDDCGPNNNSCGGGIIIQPESAADIKNSSLLSNTAEFGGGISNFGTTTISNTIISRNSANIGGGGIDNTGAITIHNSTISNNAANQLGGGILTDSDSSIAIHNSTLSENSSDTAGAIYSYGTITMNNSTVSGNFAKLTGGIFTTYDSTLSIANSTITDNISNPGRAAGIVSFDSASTSTTISNTIVSSNILSGTNTPYDLGLDTDGIGTDSFTSGGYNLIGVMDENITAFPGVGDQINVTVFLLDVLANNGGNTQTHALLPGSPAIDAGGNCNAATDQRGIFRPQGIVCDIGAFESQGFSLNLTSGDLQTTPVNTIFPEPLALTVNSIYSEPVSGGQITFSAPISGAGLTFTETVATIENDGSIRLWVTANDQAGSYPVTAVFRGNVGEDLIFDLTNTRLVFLPIMMK